MIAARRMLGATVIVAAVAALAGCGVAIPPLNPAPTAESTSTAADFSTLDDAGVARIRESGHARFDLRDGEIDKTSLGLTASDIAPDVVSPDRPITLEIVGPQGSVTATTDHIRFFTTDASPTVDRITYFVVAETSDELFALLKDGADDYGLDRSSIDGWIDSVSSDSGGKSSFSFQPGTALGMNVNYDVRYDEAEPPQVIIVDVYPLAE